MPDNYQILENKVVELNQRVQQLEKEMKEMKAEVSDHENILRPATLYLPHAGWDFNYSNVIDVLKGLIAKVYDIEYMKTQEEEKSEEFYF